MPTTYSIHTGLLCAVTLWAKSSHMEAINIESSGGFVVRIQDRNTGVQ